ncbi:hypothetical protein [Streptomyces agglomeratus]|uniref:hypothetical protein n=1 Tax=Streptomyces agglomeratus TaxID=285458 RepID=UPI00114CA30D|nr:hypothetical protein [Streptomyces agglomeratus]
MEQERYRSRTFTWPWRRPEKPTHLPARLPDPVKPRIGTAQHEEFLESQYTLAYEAAVLALTQQDGTLGNLRNRSSGLFAIAGLIASFSTTVGLVDAGHAIPTWVAFALLGVLVVMCVLMALVLRPIHGKWVFGPDAGEILRHEGDMKELRGGVARGMVEAVVSNEQIIERRSAFYLWGVVLLWVEVSLVVAGVVIAR